MGADGVLLKVDIYALPPWVAMAIAVGIKFSAGTSP